MAESARLHPRTSNRRWMLLGTPTKFVKDVRLGPIPLIKSAMRWVVPQFALLPSDWSPFASGSDEAALRPPLYIEKGRLKRVLADWCPPYCGYHLFYPSRRQSSAAFVLVVNALRHRSAKEAASR